MRVPKGMTRGVKYIVDQASTSEAVGLQAFQIAVGTDNATAGQTGVTDTAVPVGCKIAKISLTFCLSNLTSQTTFVHWAIQRRRTGQASLNPIAQGGNPLRSTIMMCGIKSVGKDQNTDLVISFKIPKKLQRMADGDIWQLTTNNSTIVTTVGQAVYKIWQ